MQQGTIEKKCMEYFLSVFYSIYDSANRDKSLDSKGFLKKYLENIKITTTVEYNLNVAAISYYDYRSNSIYINDKYKHHIPTYIHEYTHALDPTDVFSTPDDKFAISEEQQQKLYDIYSSEVMTTTYNQQYNLKDICLKKMIIREARAENNELRYILYTKYKRSEIASFDTYIASLSEKDFEEAASQLGYHTEKRWRSTSDVAKYDIEKINKAKEAIISIA